VTGFLDLAVAALNFLGSIFGTFGHVGTFCSTIPTALHVTANSGLELSPTIRTALIGTPTC
jgi:hypothetical protein